MPVKANKESAAAEKKKGAAAAAPASSQGDNQPESGIQDSIPGNEYGWRLKNGLPGDSNASFEYQGQTITVDLIDGFLSKDDPAITMDMVLALRGAGFEEDYRYKADSEAAGIRIIEKTIEVKVPVKTVYTLSHPDNTPSQMVSVAGYTVYGPSGAEGSPGPDVLGVVDIVDGKVVTEDKLIMQALANAGFIISSIEEI